MAGESVHSSVSCPDLSALRVASAGIAFLKHTKLLTSTDTPAEPWLHLSDLCSFSVCSSAGCWPERKGEPGTSHLILKTILLVSICLPCNLSAICKGV